MIVFFLKFYKFEIMSYCYFSYLILFVVLIQKFLGGGVEGGIGNSSFVFSTCGSCWRF